VSTDALSFYNDFTNNFGMLLAARARSRLRAPRSLQAQPCLAPSRAGAPPRGATPVRASARARYRAGPEDKMLECNGAMVFIDLDNVWEQVCSQCVSTAGECTSLQVTVVSSLSDCQAACQQAPTCTAINYAAPTQGCELLSCTVNPPTQASDPSNDLWSYNRGTALQYNNITNAWTGYAISAAACPDPNQPPAPLVPRDSGYTVGIIFDKGQGGGDRLVVLGGDQGENNVYFSDDCGRESRRAA